LLAEVKMIRSGLLALVAFAVAAGGASAAVRPPARPAAKAAAPAPSVMGVLERTWLGDGASLREMLVAEAAPREASEAPSYAEARAAIRACRAERYAAARDSLLDGRPVPPRRAC